VNAPALVVLPRPDFLKPELQPADAPEHRSFSRVDLRLPTECAPAKGGPLRAWTVFKLWDRARTAVVGLQLGFRWHDLRHTGTTLTAATGASTRELMYRMGHASSAGALRYQHATVERDAEMARLLEERVTARPKRAQNDADLGS
jgi:integrase